MNFYQYDFLIDCVRFPIDSFFDNEKLNYQIKALKKEMIKTNRNCCDVLGSILKGYIIIGIDKTTIGLLQLCVYLQYLNETITETNENILVEATVRDELKVAYEIFCKSNRIQLPEDLTKDEIKKRFILTRKLMIAYIKDSYFDLYKHFKLIGYIRIKTQDKIDKRECFFVKVSPFELFIYD